MAALIQVSSPAAEPVTLAEIKELLRVDTGDTSQDATLLDLITSARSWAETFTKKAFVQQTWRLLLDYFPGYYAMVTGQPGSSPVLTGPALLAGIRYAIVLPFPPVILIGTFQYQNENGEITVMDPATDFIQDLQSNPARLTPPFGQMWPVARVVLNAVQIDFQTGYAVPISLTSPAGSPDDNNTVDAGEGYTFQPTDVERPLLITGAGPGAGTLNTIVSGISSPPSSQATVRDAITTDVANQLALLVNNPNGPARHWAQIRTGIKFKVKADFEPASDVDYELKAKMALTPVRDLRL